MTWLLALSWLKRVPAWAWVGLALLGAGWWYGHSRYTAGHEAGVSAEQGKTAKAESVLAKFQKDAAEAVARFETEARATEQRHAADLNRIDREAREDAKKSGDAAYDRAVADVRSGRLRNVWSCPTAAAQVSGPAASASQPNAAADDRGEAIGRVLRIAAECDSQVRALQQVTISDRSGANP